MARTFPSERSGLLISDYGISNGYDDIGGLIEQGIDFLDEVLPGK